MHTAERVTLARLPSGIPIQTTIHTYEGDVDGPTVYVQAAQHGREINGTAVLRRVHERLLNAAERDDSDTGATLRGRVVAVPVVDPLTFDRVSYTTPESLDSVNANMNRCWPGNPEGTLHQRMAARLWEEVTVADVAVDLHTSSPETLTHTVYLAGDEQSRALAEAFGTDLVLAEVPEDDDGQEWKDRGFDGKFRVAATREGIPSITPELAHNRQFVEPAIETGVEGVLNVLCHVGVLDGDPDVPDEQRVARNHLGRVIATESGLYQPAGAAELGESVDPGDHLGIVFDPTTYERLQTVEADESGVVYSVTREATVTAGQTLVGVAMHYDRDDAVR